MAQVLKPGDAVSWETSQGSTEGKVVRKQTKETKIKGHVVKATPDDPQYIVETTNSHKRAAHKPGALKKIKGTTS